jgi:hypothetical protein
VHATHDRVSIAELQARHVALNTAEALAVVQGLIAAGMSGTPPHRPLGPPSPRTVLIASDGSVVLRGCAVKPIVLEMAILLHQLLPPGTPGVSGGLRYAIARALHDVIAPPFESLADFSRALERFEHADRRQVVRALYARGAAAAGPEAVRVVRIPIAITVLAGLVLIGAGERMHSSRRAADAARVAPVEAGTPASDTAPRAPDPPAAKPPARARSAAAKDRPARKRLSVPRIRFEWEEL